MPKGKSSPLADSIQLGAQLRSEIPRTETVFHSPSITSASNKCVPRFAKRNRRWKVPPCQQKKRRTRSPVPYMSPHLEHLSRPRLRSVINTWRDYKEDLTPEVICRFRNLLDADTPYRPAQAYDFFESAKLQKSKKKGRCRKKDTQAILKHGTEAIPESLKSKMKGKSLCNHDLIVRLIRALQTKFATPMNITLEGSMLRLSDIVLRHIANIMKVRKPNRASQHPKSIFYMEIADQTTLWIDEILEGCDDKMLMMNADEDDDVMGITLNMFSSQESMGGSGSDSDAEGLFRPTASQADLIKHFDDEFDPRPPAYEKLTGDDLVAFKILTKEMEKKESEELLKKGVVKLSYESGADELERAKSFTAVDFEQTDKAQTQKKLETTVANTTPQAIKQAMTGITEMASKFLSQMAKQSQHKTPEFKLLVSKMKKRGDEKMITERVPEPQTYFNEAKTLAISKNLDEKPGPVTSSMKLVEKEMKEDIKGKMQQLFRDNPKVGQSAGMTDTMEKTAAYLTSQHLRPDNADGLATGQSSGGSGGGTGGTGSTGPGSTGPGSTGPASSGPTGPSTPHSHGGLTEEELREAEEAKKRADMERQKMEAEQLLRDELAKKGGELLYSTDSTEVTNKEGSKWLGEAHGHHHEPITGDALRLRNKLEGNLDHVVADKVPSKMKGLMHDVVEDGATVLADRLLAEEQQRKTKELLVKEMQRRGSKPFIKVDVKTETYYTAAQRLKKALATPSGLTEKNPDLNLARHMTDELIETTQATTPSKLQGAMNETIKEASNYLSTRATKPDDDIDSKVKLLKSMDEAGSKILLSGKINKSYKNAANYLKSLTSDEDKINKPDSALQGEVVKKLTTLVEGQNVKSAVISENAKLLVSLAVREGELTEDLKTIVTAMDKKGNEHLLWHGDICKTYKDGADQLRGKTADQLAVDKLNPIALRKIDIKLTKLMEDKPKIGDALKISNKFLAVKLLEPATVRVCRCMKNKSVQCELWCNEILRFVKRPCCECASTTSPQRDVSCPTNSSYKIKFIPCSRSTVGRELAGSSSLNTSSHASSIATYFVTTRTQANKPRSKTKNSLPTLLSSTDVDKVTACELESRVTSSSDHTSKAEVYKKSQEDTMIESDSKLITNFKSLKTEYQARAPIITTGKVVDWHSMTVGLMWNVRAWRDWIQDNIDLGKHYESDIDTEDHSWDMYQRRVSAEVTRWRLYNMFSNQITSRLGGGSEKLGKSEDEDTLKAWQREILEMKNIFNKWTQWFALLIKETNSLRNKFKAPEKSLNQLRWDHFKKTIVKCTSDWAKYNNYLQVSYLEKYKDVISKWLPTWSQEGPVWVISAGGAVPSGAIAAGLYENEVIWLARSSHGARALPAALHPSKHCAWVYAEGKVHYHSKYQILCNAEVSWTPWRAGTINPHSVIVAPGVYIGRVIYRGSHLIGAVKMPNYCCNINIFGRPFSFKSFELLVLLPPK